MKKLAAEYVRCPKAGHRNVPFAGAAWRSRLQQRQAGLYMPLLTMREPICTPSRLAVSTGSCSPTNSACPILTKVECVTVAAMARIIAELYDDISVPFGVNVLWDPYASLDLAVATGAQFVREIFTGVYASDFGLWDTNCGAIVRHQHAIGGKDIRLFFNILPEAAAYLANRDIVSVARSTVFNAGPDALCISGLTAGEETSTATLRLVKDALPDIAVVANTGVHHANVTEQLTIADAAIIGTAFKRNGVFENPVDADRVRALMDKVEELR